ncbi:MAG: RagB/SusD family nutrient uptake outer membrane protein [Tannerella sp.]|nr:RagB/SusD family nutrient uptake outer membrane protein [Tannerella sp.]
MKNIKKILPFSALCISLNACETYLEKTPDSEITSEQVFSSYRNFQGYIDDLYGDGLIVYHIQAYTSSFDFADDVACNRDFPSGYAIPRGNYMWIHSNTHQNPFVTTDDSPHFGLWDRGWANIRLCNEGLDNLHLLINHTQEEYNRLKGQLLFFRAWNHFEIAKYWGGLPYIVIAFKPDDDMKVERLSFKETLLHIIADLTDAAELLPVMWDDTPLGSNTGRITKGAAMALKSRALLYAASPLTSKTENGTAEYDIELCKQAAETAYEVIKLADQGVYALVAWNDYSYNFADSRGTGISSRAIYTTETIFAKIKPASAIGAGQVTNFGVGRLHNSGRFGGNSVVTAPTANFINLYETATGYDIIDAPQSDYNQIVPWANRDPRLRKTILTDGVKWVDKNNNAEAYIQLYTNVGGSTSVGLDRGSGSSVQSLTGYLIRKYIPYKVNNQDAGSDYNNFRFNCPYIRLAEMYLNYAEAVNEAYGPQTVPADFASTLTAVEAVNIVRRRVKLPVSEDLSRPDELQEYGTQSMPDVLDRYTADKNTFRSRIRNERSVELAFEGQRFIDLRRWYLSHLPEYTKRYGHEFNKEHTVCNEVLLFESPFEDRHYWFPFHKKYVEQYAAFKQNPGW